MSKQKEVINAAGFTSILVAANADTDITALCKQVIEALAASEQVIIVLQSNAEFAGKTISDLKSQIGELNIQIGDLQEDILGHETAYDKLNELYEAIKNAPAGTDTTEMEAQLAEAYKQISELGKKLDMQEKTRDQEGILVEYDNVPKLLIGKSFTIKAKRYTVDEVAANQDLLKHLYTTKSHSLVDPIIDPN